MSVQLIKNPKRLPESAGTRSIAWLVWMVWAALLIIALVTVLRYARNIPIAEDWFMVPALTGHEDNLWRWLWAQNNEHRVPFPKGVLLLLLKASGGDFRSGMVATTMSMGAMAAAMIWAARRIRGFTSLTDVFFPATLLHLGHRDNFGFNWQLVFVTPTLIACVFLLLIVVYGDRPTGRAAVIAGICLVLLPLSGLNGLVMVFPMSLWFLLVAVPLLGRSASDSQTPRWVAPVLLGSVGVALLLTGYYLHDFARPSFNPPNPGFQPSLELAGRLLALSFGPSASISWTVSVAAACAVLLATAILLIVRGMRQRGTQDGKRLFGLLLLSASMVVLTFGVAWGRAGWVPRFGIPMRYVIIATPLLCCAYYAWLLFGPPVIRNKVLVGLAVAMCVLIPLNEKTSHGFADWYDQEMTALERDLRAGMPRLEIAERHKGLLLHWNVEALKANLALLRDTGRGPFRNLSEDAPGTRNGGGK